jgi:hypothetical protein
MNYREGESVREQGGHWIQGGARLQVKETPFSEVRTRDRILPPHLRFKWIVPRDGYLFRSPKDQSSTFCIKMTMTFKNLNVFLRRT